MAADRRSLRLPTRFRIRTMSPDRARRRSFPGSPERRTASSRSTGRCRCSRRWPRRRTRRACGSWRSACGINRSTAWRLLATLEAHGLVERDPVTRATRRLRGVPDRGGRRLRRRSPGGCGRCSSASPSTAGESVTLAAARRFSLVYVDQVDPPGVARPDWMGRSLPLHATSSGKVFLAWLPEDERDAVLPPHLEAYTPQHDHRPAAARPRAGRDPARSATAPASASSRSSRTACPRRCSTG